MPLFQASSRVGAQASGAKDKKKESSNKPKNKGPSYKLYMDIKSSIDIKKILNEKILNTKIKFFLKEVLGITKKDFLELIIDVKKRKT